MEKSKRPLSQHRRDLLATAYAAFNRRDIDGVLALMTPRVEWPNGLEGSYVHGPEQVREYWTRQWATLNPRVQPVQMDEDSEGRAVVRVHQVVSDSSGVLLLDRLVEHIYTFEGRSARSPERRFGCQLNTSRISRASIRLATLDQQRFRRQFKAPPRWHAVFWAASGSLFRKR